MTPPVKLTLTVAAPGADANDYVLFDSSTVFPGLGYFAMLKMQRLVISILNSQAGTLKGYRSATERGAGAPQWTQVYQASVAAASGNNANWYDLLVAPYDDYKLVWTNGGVAQATWVLDAALHPSQVKVT